MTFKNAKNFLDRMTLTEEPLSPKSPTSRTKLAAMIKIPKKQHVPTALQATFYGEKEERTLPPSILKALTKRPRNVFIQPVSTEAETVWLDNEMQSDYMSRHFS